MRKPFALSHTSLRLYCQNREEFYLRSLALTRAPRLPQPLFAAAGSAFDAFCKSAIADELGIDGFQLDSIFETQVEPQNRDWGIEHGKRLFEAYRASGCYDYLLGLLRRSTVQPRMEFGVTREVAGIPFTGRPDLSFALQRPIKLDWKVLGYLSQSSPSQCYVKCQDCWAGKQSRSHGKTHKKCQVTLLDGIEIHSGSLQDSGEKYADQLAIYSWLEGEEPGNDNVLCWIDEICCGKAQAEPRQFRVATHRAKVSATYQLALFQKAKECWHAIESGHFYQELSREDSDAKCQVLEDTARYLFEHPEELTYREF